MIWVHIIVLNGRPVTLDNSYCEHNSIVNNTYLLTPTLAITIAIDYCCMLYVYMYLSWETSALCLSPCMYVPVPLISIWYIRRTNWNKQQSIFVVLHRSRLILYG